MNERVIRALCDEQTITEYSKNIHQLLLENKVEEAKSLLPLERLYPLPDSIALNIKLS